MKKLLSLAVMILALQIVEAQFHDSIYEYLKKVDVNYPIVVGDKGTSSDSIAASELVLGLLKANRVSLNVKLESEVSPSVNKILVGHPCGNKLVKLQCEGWPFDDEEAVVKMIGNDLVISGTDGDATINAAKIIAKYRDYGALKKFKYVLISGGSITGLSDKFDCGDNACDDGEKYFCPLDCEKVDCEEKCKELGFTSSSCVQEVISAKALSCDDTGLEIGKGFCASSEICCCAGANEETKKDNQNETQVIQPSQPVIVPKEKSFDLKKSVTENVGAIVVFFALLLIVTVLVVVYRRVSA